MSRELDSLKEELDRRFNYLLEDFRRELEVLQKQLEELRKEQSATDRFLRGGNGGRGLSTRVTEVATKLQYLEKRVNRGRAKGWAIILVIIGSLVAALRKLVGAAH